MTHRILVIEDDTEVRALIAEVLTLDDLDVDIATDGAHALRLLEEHSYNLIVSEMRMPSLDGRELYRVLRQRYGAELPRIIFVTAHSYEPHYANLLFETGEPVLLKPFDRKQLRDLVTQALSLQS